MGLSVLLQLPDLIISIEDEYSELFFLQRSLEMLSMQF